MGLVIDGHICKKFSPRTILYYTIQYHILSGTVVQPLPINHSRSTPSRLFYLCGLW